MEPENGQDQPPKTMEDYEREAAEMERSPEFLKTIAAIVAPADPAAPTPPRPGGEPPAAPEPPPADAPPAPPAAAPAPPAKEPEAPQPATAAAPAEPTTDHAKIHEELGGDPARMAVEIAELRRKASAPPAPAAAPAKPADEPAAAPAKEPEPEPAQPIDARGRLEDIAKRQKDKPDSLTPVERVFMDEVRTCSQLRAEAESRAKALTDHQATLQTTRDQLDEAKKALTFLEKKAKADPDNFNVSEQVNEARELIEKLERAEDAQALRERRLQAEQDDAVETFTQRRTRLLREVEHVGNVERQERESAQKVEEDEKKNTAAWNAAFPKVLEAAGLSKVSDETKEFLQIHLTNAAHAELTVRHATGKGDFEDLSAWMLGQAQVLKKLADGIRGDAVSTYVDKRRQDIHGNAPEPGRGSSAPAPPAGDDGGAKPKMSWEDANYAAEVQWARDRGLPIPQRR